MRPLALLLSLVCVTIFIYVFLHTLSAYRVRARNDIPTAHENRRVAGIFSRGHGPLTHARRAR